MQPREQRIWLAALLFFLWLIAMKLWQISDGIEGLNYQTKHGFDSLEFQVKKLQR